MIDQTVFLQKELEKLKQWVKKAAPKKIFLVRGDKSYQNSGAVDFVNQVFGNQEIVSFYDFDPNPQLEDLKKGIALFKQGYFDLILAIGGGSVLDMAKLISVFSHQKNKLEDLILVKAQIEEIKTPLLAVPTTAGTGAEATQFAVLYMGKKKYSVANPSILPDLVYLNSSFSKSASSYLTACTGLDAFCQAVESLWSVNANKESEEYSLRAIELIWKNLFKAVQENNDVSKEMMQEASFIAGKAINITKTTAPHALSYAFTSYYDIPHGHAVALSLPFFLKYNYQVTEADCTDTKGAIAVVDRINKLLNILNVNFETSDTELKAFFNSLGININISTLIKSFDATIIIDNINLERLSNNPRLVSKKAIGKFLENN